ncbi:hypothetical protein ACFL54_03945 [Planctomycetota bacterium]
MNKPNEQADVEFAQKLQHMRLKSAPEPLRSQTLREMEMLLGSDAPASKHAWLLALAAAAVLLFGAFHFLKPYFSRSREANPEKTGRINIAVPEEALYKLFDIMGQDPDYRALISHGVVNNPELYQTGDIIGEYLVARIESEGVTLESLAADDSPLTLTPDAPGNDTGPQLEGLALAYRGRLLTAGEYHLIVEGAFAGDPLALKLIARIAGNAQDPYHEQVKTCFGSRRDIEVASQLIAKARDKSSSVRLEVVKNLRHAKGPLPLAFFREVLEDENDRLITFAIDTVVARGDLRALPALRNLQRSTSNPKLAKICERAVEAVVAVEDRK